MDYDIDILVSDLLAKMKERGIEAKVTYCINPQGTIQSFEIKIIGYYD